jgi:hypothetical protein
MDRRCAPQKLDLTVAHENKFIQWNEGHNQVLQHCHTVRDRGWQSFCVLSGSQIYRETVQC